MKVETDKTERCRKEARGTMSGIKTTEDDILSERNLGRLWDIVDTDPYLSKLDDDSKTDVFGEILESKSWTSQAVRRLMESIPPSDDDITGFTGISSQRPVKGLPTPQLSDERYASIKPVLKEQFKSIGSEDFDPEEELFDRAAFSLIGRPYIKPGEQRNSLFEKDIRLESKFVDAWNASKLAYMRMQGDSDVYNQGTDELVEYAKLLYCDIDSDLKAKFLAEEKEAKKGILNSFGWHKKLITAGLIALFAGAVAIGVNSYLQNPNNGNDSQQKQRVKQLMDSGVFLNESQAKIFDGKYSNWTIGNVYNSSVISFGRLWNINQTLADSIAWYTTSPTSPMIANSSVGIWTIVDTALQHPGLGLTPREFANAARLLASIDGIGKLNPNVLAGGAEQADILLYKVGLAGHTASSEDYAWNAFYIHAADYAVKLIRSGIVPIDKMTREQIGGFIAPFELTEMRFYVGSYQNAQGQTVSGLCVEPHGSNLDNAISNVNPNPVVNGTSVQEFLTNLGNKIFEEKGVRYQVAIEDAYSAWTHAWPNCHTALKQQVDESLKIDPLAVQLLGNMGVHAMKIIMGEEMMKPIIYMFEQTTPSFKVLLARSMGRYAYQMLGDYGQMHYETAVQKNDGTTLGLWVNKAARDLDQKDLPTVFYERLPDENWMKLP